MWCGLERRGGGRRRWLLLLVPGRKGSRLAVAGMEDVRFEVLLKDVEKLKVCRERLGNLSWFMRGLSEVIARACEPGGRVQGVVSGRGRSSVSAWRTREAVAACMAYVDLNPVRADLRGDAGGERVLRGGGPSAGGFGRERSWRRGRRLAGRNPRRPRLKRGCWRKARGEVERVRFGFRRWMRRRVGWMG